MEIDNEGWVPVSQLLQSLRPMRREWKALSNSDLLRMIEVSEKKRYEIKADKIRALYGHSIPQRMSKVPEMPPEILYHGTSPDYIDSIFQEGLKPMSRQFVHLSIDIDTAYKVGKRKSKEPAILIIQAKKAHNNGMTFYKGNDSVWLADSVPSDYIDKRGQ